VGRHRAGPPVTPRAAEAVPHPPRRVLRQEYERLYRFYKDLQREHSALLDRLEQDTEEVPLPLPAD